MQFKVQPLPIEVSIRRAFGIVPSVQGDDYPGHCINPLSAIDAGVIPTAPVNITQLTLRSDMTFCG
jgi:hypothetical protein